MNSEEENQKQNLNGVPGNQFGTPFLSLLVGSSLCG
jgi:hypothetical protein